MDAFASQGRAARNSAEPETIKFFVSNAPAGTPFEWLVYVGYSRWSIERCFEEDNDELGFDHFENALRCVAVGRNNWLFCGSDNGGKTAAILFSFMATCRRHEIDPFAYLRDVLTHLPATPINEIDQFLLDRWTPPSDTRPN